MGFEGLLFIMHGWEYQLQMCWMASIQLQLQKQYSVELRNPGVSCVRVRQDSRIMASGGWDGRCVEVGVEMGVLLAQ